MDTLLTADLASRSLVRDPATLAAIPELPQDSSLPSPQHTFRYDGISALWKPLEENLTNTDDETKRPDRLVVANQAPEVARQGGSPT